MARVRSDGEAVLLAEFDQAWQHYRHIEASRSQYLAFFFTVALGSVGLGGALLNDLGEYTAGSHLGVSVGAFLLDLIALVSYATVRKWRTVLEHYASVIHQVRTSLYAHIEAPPDLMAQVSISLRLPPALRRGLFSAQQLTEWVLATGFLVLLGVQAWAWSWTLGTAGLSKLSVLVATICFYLTLALGLRTLLVVLRLRHLSLFPAEKERLHAKRKSNPREGQNPDPS